MGASGAGKTTLLDVLANKKTGGHITGTILFRGKPRDAMFNRLAGYVEQTDNHEPTATVREAVYFSARLRLPSDVSDEECQRRADQVQRRRRRCVCHCTSGCRW